MATKGWRDIAKAQGLEIPASDWERIVPALDALEQTSRPLAGRLPPELEPSICFKADEADE